MYPYLLNNEHLPMYGICMIFGMAVAILVVLFIKKDSPIPRDDRIYCTGFALISGIFGAKLLSVLTNIGYIIENNLSFYDIIKNGFVFYGGLIGGAAGILIYCLAYKIKPLEFFDLAAVALPLAQAFGRVGCFCAGCCFGRATDSVVGVVYSHPIDPNTPVGTPLLPTQLFETAYCAIIFAILLWLSRKKLPTGALTAVYALSYAVCRFVNEFFRGDEARGFLLGISVSQFISILIVLTVVAVFVIIKLINRKTKPKLPIK